MKFLTRIIATGILSLLIAINFTTLLLIVKDGPWNEVGTYGAFVLMALILVGLVSSIITVNKLK